MGGVEKTRIESGWGIGDWGKSMVMWKDWGRWPWAAALPMCVVSCWATCRGYWAEVVRRWVSCCPVDHKPTQLDLSFGHHGNRPPNLPKCKIDSEPKNWRNRDFSSVQYRSFFSFGLKVMPLIRVGFRVNLGWLIVVKIMLAHCSIALNYFFAH